MTTAHSRSGVWSPPAGSVLATLSVLLAGGAIWWRGTKVDLHSPVEGLVEVVGDVPSPGVYVLSEAMDVSDLLKTAGHDLGVEPDGPLRAGDRLVVHGSTVWRARMSAPLLAGGRVDINLAGAAELEALPAIGPRRAAAVLEYRSQQGRFSTVEELDDVAGIGPVTVERVRPFVMVGPSAHAVPPRRHWLSLEDGEES